VPLDPELPLDEPLELLLEELPELELFSVVLFNEQADKSDTAIATSSKRLIITGCALRKEPPHSTADGSALAVGGEH
jgi:hypothetical protein